ncbi:hypothetical protein GCM10010211_58040 [Streptomyces albospinus]|uniref:Uncharacterized protein n=1 Tax=Streptomyces albospinus TaxID=285515 RepID=A0ABQ2VG25_9ACTN|nr:hypothetical protein GCM10010211_58040 [Streptomyces albospinus]
MEAVAALSYLPTHRTGEHDMQNMDNNGCAEKAAKKGQGRGLQGPLLKGGVPRAVMP